MASPFKLTIHRWAETHGLSILSATLSHQAVTFAEMMWQGSELFRSGKLSAELPPRPLPSEWLELYHDRGRVFQGTIDALPEWEMSGEDAADTLRFSFAISRCAQHDPERFKAEFRRSMGPVSAKRFRAWWRLSVREARKEYRCHLDEMMDWVSGKRDADMSNFGDTLATYVELHFFMRVVLVSLVEYSELPRGILRRAERGCEKSVEKLLRLDDQALAAPCVQQWINGGGGVQRQARLEQAMNWIKAGPVGKNDEWHFKQCVGGLISAISRRAFFIVDGFQLKPQPLTAPQIQSLFDAVYRDKEGRRQAIMRDPDFAKVTPDGWARQVRRYRRLWDQVLFPRLADKK